MNNDLGLDYERIFTNIELDNDGSKYLKLLKKQSLEKKTKNDETYYVLPTQNMLIYHNHVYDFRYAYMIHSLLHHNFDCDEVSQIFNLPYECLKDLCVLYNNLKKSFSNMNQVINDE